MWLWATLHTYTSQLVLMRVAVTARRASKTGRASVTESSPSWPRSSSHVIRNRHDQAMRCAITGGPDTPLGGGGYTENTPQMLTPPAAAAGPGGKTRALVTPRRAP